MPQNTYGERDRGDTDEPSHEKKPFPHEALRIELKCAVEQRLARQAHNLEVVGSIPTGATPVTPA